MKSDLETRDVDDHHVAMGFEPAVRSQLPRAHLELKFGAVASHDPALTDIRCALGEGSDQ